MTSPQLPCDSTDSDQSTASSELTLAQAFAAWLEPLSTAHPLLIAGAGLSFGLVPTADELARGVGKRQQEIETSLGISTTWTDFSDSSGLYNWADSCIQQLGTADAKVRLANAMGLTTDKGFLAQAGVGPRGTTPRHRVLGRLAREGKIRAIWSFNWDCWLEACFEAVGMRRYADEHTRIANEGWVTRYHVWFDDAPLTPATDCRQLFKAHGCVRELHAGRGNFVIGMSEMEMTLAQQPITRTNLLAREIEQGDAIAVGWSATEKYVLDIFREHVDATLFAPTARLSVVDLDPDQENHRHVAKAYPTIPHHPIGVAAQSPGTVDDLMLWIQTLRGLRALKEVAPQEQKHILTQIESAFPEYKAPSLRSAWIVSFFDDWLPVWLRLCCLTGAQTFDIPQGKLLQVLPSDRRDAHIPWCNPLINGRKDHEAAITLLLRLQQLHAASPNEAHWDFDELPGALWDAKRGHLLLPIPIWASPEGLRTALRPLVEAIQWQSKARIRTAAVLPLQAAPQTSETPVAQATLRDWQESLASCFNHATLAQAQSIKALELDALLLPSHMPTE